MESKILERNFQAGLVKELKKRFPGCIVQKMDANQKQGIPDLLILHKSHWAALECKASLRAKRQPNQEYYISKMDKMSFARFICPENQEEVLDELQRAFRTRRTTRSLQSKPKLVASVRQEEDN